jgi:hypothetical protein
VAVISYEYGTLAIKVCLTFNFAVVFSSMFFCFPLSKDKLFCDFYVIFTLSTIIARFFTTIFGLEFYVRTLFNTASSAAIRFQCVGGYWDGTLDCCDFDIGKQTLKPLG